MSTAQRKVGGGLEKGDDLGRAIAVWWGKGGRNTVSKCIELRLRGIS